MKLALMSRATLAQWGVRSFLPLALGVLSLAVVEPAWAQEQMLRTLTVTGQGTESIPTTMTQVQLGVEVQADTAVAAQQEAARRSASLVEFLRSQNVEQLQTTGISLNPRYNYNNGNQRIVGYTATNTVSFEVDTDEAGNILDEAVDAGATRIDSVSFVAEDEAIAVAQRQALQEAAEDAQDQADVVLAALGLTRQDVVRIQIDGASSPPPPPIMYRADFAAAESAPTPVIGGEQEVQASLTLEISFTD